MAEKTGTRQVKARAKSAKPKTTRKKVAASQVSDLKDQVMKQVSAQGEKASRTLDDFREGVLPPSKRPRRRWGADTWLTLALIVGVVVVIGLLVIGGGGDTPAATLKKLERALAEMDMEMIDHHVDFDRVAASVVDQFYGDPRLDASQLPVDLKDKLPTGSEDNVQSLIKPGLAEGLKRDAVALLEGSTTLADTPPGLFRRIWEGISDGQPLSVDGVRRLEVEEDTAEADILLHRADLDDPIPLTLFLEKGEQGWEVVSLPGVENTLLAVVAARVQPVASREDAFVPAIGQVLEVSSVRKAAGVGGDKTQSLLVTVKLRNGGPTDIKAFSAELLFKDAAGQFMKSFTLSDAVGVQRGMRLEKTWRLPIDPGVRMERHLYKLPQGAIQLEVVPKLVELADGRVIRPDA
jgi:hypothetical protein